MNQYLKIAVGVIAALAAFWVIKFAVSADFQRDSYAPPSVYVPKPTARFEPIDPPKVDLRDFMSHDDLEFCRKGFPTGARKEIWEEYLAKCEGL